MPALALQTRKGSLPPGLRNRQGRLAIRQARGFRGHDELTDLSSYFLRFFFPHADQEERLFLLIDNIEKPANQRREIEQ